MVIQTTRFGEIEVDENKIIEFEKGIPGIEELKRFIFLTPKESYPIFFLQSIDEKDIALPVVNPYDFKADYNPKVKESVFKEIEIESDEDILVLNVAVVPKDLKKMTVNLAAPILINIKKFKAKQVILDDKQYSIREPMYNSLVTLIQQGGKDDAGAVTQEG